MKKWFQDRSIFFKLLAAGLTAILLIVMLLSVVVFYFFKNSDRANRIYALADSVSIQMLHARLTGKNFILRDLQKKEFYRTGTSRNLQEHISYISSARAEINNLINLLSPERRENVRMLLALVDEYSSIVSRIVESYRKRGFKNWGLLGEWRQAIHDVEVGLAQIKRIDLEEGLLRLRRHEKDYLLRGDVQYIDLIMRQLRSLQNQISEMGGPRASAILKELNIYEKSFREYVVIEEEIGRTDEEGLQKAFLTVTSKISPIVDNVLHAARITNQKARRDFIWASIFVYFFGIGVGGAIFYLFARSISSTLVDLKNAVSSVGKGRLDTKVAINSKDEIGIVAAAFNKMTDDLNKVTVSKNYVDKIIQSMADTLIVINPRLIIETVNRAALDLLGYREDDLVGNPVEVIFGRDPAHMRLIDELLAGKSLGNVEMSYVRKDGREISVLFSGSVMTDNQGNMQGIVCLAQDNTKRKQAEYMLRKSERELRLLSSKILTAQENERKRVASELHDGIGQSLTGIKFFLENALKRVKQVDDVPRIQELDAAIPMIRDTIEETRRIAMGLRPSSLDDIGIKETISWFCRQFQAVYSMIRIQTCIEIEEDLMSESLNTAIFRIVQESFNNVAKHSKADLVHLNLQEDDGAVDLVIEDNGIGFIVEQEVLRENTDKGFGLAGMKERAELSGGTFSICSEVRKGTVIRASWSNPGG